MMIKPEDCKDITVLYAEDDETARNATVRILSKLFPKLVVAEDGQDGLDKYKENDIDLIITDINMPKLNGIEMLEKIKEIDSNFYAIVLTAYSDKENFMATISLGVRGYITKPINVTQLIETLTVGVEFINKAKELNILKQYKDMADRSSIVSKTNPKGEITFVNDKFCEISGYTKEELIGKNHRILRDPDAPKELFQQMWHEITSKREWKGKLKNITKDGSSYYVDALVAPILDSKGKIIEYIGLRNEITELIDPKKQIHDKMKVCDYPVLVMLKMENYTIFEHLYDDKILDELLGVFERMLFTYLPDGFEVDSIFNLGNGEFALLQLNKETSLSASQLEIQLKKLQSNIENSVTIVDEYEFEISVLISFSNKKESIFENTKQGLVKAKDKKVDIVFANDIIENLREEALKNSKTIKMIQKAIEDNRIISHFQPIVNNKTGKIEKYESLVRLEDEDGKLISPFFFLDVAKETKYYNQITSIVIDNSFAALEKTDKEISINLSALDIEDLELRNKLINLVMANTHNAHRIVFELLEDEEVKDFEVVKDFISLVKTFGIQIAIDDFGAGVSNFERLLDFQPDILKIDACLIKNIDKDKYSRDVVETIQLFAWKQDIKTVSEFVASEEILQTVKDIGVNYSQGFLLGKPEPLV
jgi:PAS domain S-box-containing protein